MSLVGININTKANGRVQSQLSINQAARPLTANMAQVGLGKTFSGLLPGRAPPPAPSLDLPLAQKGKYPKSRSSSPRALEVSSPLAGLSTQHAAALPGPGQDLSQHHLLGAQLVALTCGCLLQSFPGSCQLPPRGQSLLEYLIGS